MPHWSPSWIDSSPSIPCASAFADSSCWRSTARAGRPTRSPRTGRHGASLADELGLEPGPALQELERAILRQDPSLEVETASSLPRVRRAILVAPRQDAGLGALLGLAEPLARRPVRELILACVFEPGGDLRASTAWLAEQRDALASRDVEARVVAFTSDAPGAEVAQLATQQDVDLVLTDAHAALVEHGELGETLEAVLHAAPCDVGVLVNGEDVQLAAGPVVVPFGGVEHDWSAVEIAAWLARSLGTSLRLAGTEAAGGAAATRAACSHALRSSSRLPSASSRSRR